MGRNKISRHKDENVPFEESQGCRRVLAAAAPRGHPCPAEDNPNTKKKSLSEVFCLSKNSKKRSHAPVAEGSRQ